MHPLCVNSRFPRIIQRIVQNCNEQRLGKSGFARQAAHMKVTRNTPARLIIEDRPMLISIMLGLFFLGTLTGALFSWAAGEMFVALFFTAFTAFIALFIFVFVRRVQVIFDRLTDTITFRARNFRNYSETVYPLHELSHAEKHGYDTARCVLIFDKGMSAGEHPLTAYSTSGPAPQRVTDAINAWLKTTTPVDSEQTKA